MKKGVAILLALLMVSSLTIVTSAQTNSDPVTIRGWGSASFDDTTGVTSYSQQLAWQALPERTGITVDWTTVSAIDQTTQFSLMMASGNLPDFFVDIDPLYYEEFGCKGALAPLNDYIKQMPNLQSLLAQDPDALPSITNADGNIYFLPRLLEPATRYWPGLFIREDYLAKVGLEVPTTTEEYYQALKAIKAEIPECTLPLTGSIAAIKTLVWPFGVGSRGIGTGITDDAFIEGEIVKYGPTDDRYREALKYIAKLYNDGLIDPEWNTITWDQTRTNMITGVAASSAGSFAGMLSTFNRLLIADGQGELLTYIAPLEGPEGIRTWQGHHTSIDQSCGMALAMGSENADAVIRMMDFFYSDEGRTLIYWGIEGETYDIVDGKKVFTEKVTSSPLGTLQYLNNFSANTSFFPTAITTEFYHATLSERAQKGNLAETEIGQQYDIRMPALRYTPEEISEVNTILADLNAYIDEYFAAFITGQLDVSDDTEWEKYINSFAGLRLDELMEYYNAAYARFVAAR